MNTLWKRLLCRLLGHKNGYAKVVGWEYVCDGCSRCGADLPKAYPYHEEYAKWH